MLRCAIVGGPQAIASGPADFIAARQPDEIMVTARIFDPEARRKSCRLLAAIHPPAGV